MSTENTFTSRHLPDYVSLRLCRVMPLCIDHHIAQLMFAARRADDRRTLVNLRKKRRAVSSMLSY